MSDHPDMPEHLAQAWHEIRQLKSRLRALSDSAIALACLVEECEAQWGDDYLWKKWRMSERFQEAKILARDPSFPPKPTPTESGEKGEGK